MFTRIAVIIITGFITLGLFGCGPEHPEIYSPIGHPANAATVSGKALAAPSALQPELTSAEPTALAPSSGKPDALSPTDRRNRPGTVRQ